MRAHNPNVTARTRDLEDFGWSIMSANRIIDSTSSDYYLFVHYIERLLGGERPYCEFVGQ